MATEAMPSPVEAAATSARKLFFWYSSREAIVWLACIFLLITLLSGITPPLQSPDEPDHLARAYLLAKGEVFLGARDGVTGGEIDTGLLDYEAVFQDIPFHYDRKVTVSDIPSSSNIAWTGKRLFTALPNTAAYLPLCYAPQALTLAFGQTVGLSVNTTYYLARAFTLLVTLVVLYCASVLYPTPPIVLALLTTPMTLFQLSSASLDSLTFGLAALTASLFMRAADRRLSFGTPMQVALCLCVVSLSTCRENLLPLTVLPTLLRKYRPSSLLLGLSYAVPLISLAWTGFALVTIRGLFTRELSTPQVIIYYLTHINKVFSILVNTFLNHAVLRSYWESFIGVLGWGDTPLDYSAYVTFGVLLLLLVALGMGSLRGHEPHLRGKLSLALAAMASIGLVFLIELIWAPFPAPVILGVYGRYFTCSLVILAYAAFSANISVSQQRWGLSISCVWLMLSVACMTPKLIYRYWLG